MYNIVIQQVYVSRYAHLRGVTNCYHAVPLIIFPKAVPFIPTTYLFHKWKLVSCSSSSILSRLPPPPSPLPTISLFSVLTGLFLKQLSLNWIHNGKLIPRLKELTFSLLRVWQLLGSSTIASSPVIQTMPPSTSAHVMITWSLQTRKKDTQSPSLITSYNYPWSKSCFKAKQISFSFEIDKIHFTLNHAFRNKIN